jgi:phage gp29-like protein
MAREKKLNTVKNITEKKPDKADVRKKITIQTPLYRVRTDIQDYKNAVIAAEQIVMPQRYQLLQVYNQCVLDAHLTAAMTQRKNLILCRNFVVNNKDGKENEEKTKLIQQKWFRDFLDYSLDSIFWGYSLIQFDSLIDDVFKCVELVPRQYVKPELHIVTDTFNGIEGTDYLENPWKNWCIGVGRTNDLGLLLKVAPLVIWKKNALGAWSEYVEKFGSPIRIGKTDATDFNSVQAMEDMLSNMSVASWGLFRLDDQIELKADTRQDAYQVFDMMINRCNSEISKLILGQTATMDEKSFVGSAEVHERVLDNVSESDNFFIEGVLNYQLKPLMVTKGLLSPDDNLCSVEDDELSLLDKSKIDIELIKTGKYKLTPEYIKEKYNTEVIEVIEPKVDTDIENVRNNLDKFYGNG